jgi:hypothetical protein
MDLARQLIAAMHADPEVAAEIRRAVLTDELLGLPRRVTDVEVRLERLAEAQERTERELHRLAEAQVRTDAHVDQLAAETAELRRMFGQFMTVTGEVLQRIEGKVDRLTIKVDEQGLVLKEHGRKLDEHGRKLDEHGIRLARIEERLG